MIVILDSIALLIVVNMSILIVGQTLWVDQIAVISTTPSLVVCNLAALSWFLRRIVNLLAYSTFAILAFFLILFALLFSFLKNVEDTTTIFLCKCRLNYGACDCKLAYRKRLFANMFDMCLRSALKLQNTPQYVLLTNLSTVSGRRQRTLPFLPVRGGKTSSLITKVSTTNVSSRRMSTSHSAREDSRIGRGSEIEWRSSMLYCVSLRSKGEEVVRGGSSSALLWLVALALGFVKKKMRGRARNLELYCAGVLHLTLIDTYYLKYFFRGIRYCI